MLFKEHFLTQCYIRKPKITLVKSKTKLIKNETLFLHKHLFSRILAPLGILRFSPSPLCQNEQKNKVIFMISATRAIRMGIDLKKSFA